MRPFLEIQLIKDQPKGTSSGAPSNTGNAKPILLFSSQEKNAVLNERVTSFNFEESNGDDLYNTRRGKKDVVKFSFLEKTTEIPVFLNNDGKFIQVRDIIRVSYGWVLENGNKIQPFLENETSRELKRQREFRVVRVEPDYSSIKSTIAITAFDRSVDLDIFPVSVLLNANKEGELNGVDYLPTVLREIARSGGLSLDEVQSSKLAGDTFELNVGNRAAVPGETLASYLRFLAQDFGFIYYVENRRLVFGPRVIPGSNADVRLVRGLQNFNPKEQEDITTAPLLSFSVEHKLTPESYKYNIDAQDKRTADIAIGEATLKKEAELLGLTITNAINQAVTVSRERNKIKQSNIDLPTVLRQTSPNSTLGGRRREEETASSRNDFELDALQFINGSFNEFFNQPRLIDAQEVRTLIDSIDWATVDVLQLEDNLTEGFKQIAKRMTEQFALRAVTATVTTIGNPLIRHNTLVKLDGDIPDQYKTNWYVHSVSHQMTPGNYTTTLKLMLGYGNDPFIQENLAETKKKFAKTANKKKDSQKRKPKDIKIIRR